MNWKKIVLDLTLCGLLLSSVPGCRDPWFEDRSLWALRLSSLESGRVEIGMALNDFVAIWGKADDVKLSRMPDAVYATLIYENHIAADGIVYLEPVRVYYFDFINSRLESWHVL